MRAIRLIALWLLAYVVGTTTRALVPAAYQDLATTVAVIVLGGFILYALIQEAPNIAQTLRRWRNEL